MRSDEIGVVLATYNGAKNLGAQLGSLQRQTLLPASLLACDDGSTDETIGILKNFKKKSPFPVEIHSTRGSLGPTENFLHAASLCQTEYIAFCDQDDIWLEHKIEACDAAIRHFRPDLILHSLVDFYVQKDGGEVVSKRWTLPNLGLIPGSKANPSIIWPGMSMVAHKRLFKGVVDLQQKWYPYLNKIRDSRPEILYIHWADMHDLLLLTRARMSGSIYLIGELLAKHRTRDGGRHSDSAKGGGLRKIPEIEAAWESRAKPYLLWALFCEDFGDYISEIGSLPEASSYYGRWSRLWSNRATIHAEQSGISARIMAFASNLWSGAYRGQWAGGFGPRSLVKDGFNTIGVRLPQW